MQLPAEHEMKELGGITMPCASAALPQTWGFLLPPPEPQKHHRVLETRDLLAPPT